MPELKSESDVALVTRVVLEAGAIAREIAARDFNTKHKSDGSPVTEADLAVNAYLTEHLRKARPDYAWLSEENEDDNSRFSAKRIFVVDPIDGTLAFVKRRPHFTVCVGIVEDGQPVTGVVYNPMTEECFSAAKGEGAFLNGERISVRPCEGLDGIRLLASKTTLNNPRWQQPWPEMHVENPNSIAYRIALVAAGKFDAALTMQALHDWDVAAADIILREAGGIMTSLEGASPVYNAPAVIQPNVLAAGPHLHAILRNRIDQNQ
ncbi:myo-inositol-1(or 4)-monophosphatase [Rhizomicrobium palustre]|uniref:Myo-inositol-1(Or 4)-monophosphatase n=1 Tax=Rhizomicrobium palustre TaxID=189966 RepID=A0A846N0B7_9PROT|nr:3'(2'),5'-bisphosphate nucleotidase CysQ [Rhizomicrobium palustre]NIK89318.1 myo-inositol-1(or 4)-monophosphatase [Rhizomicrobium palustre]